VCVYECVYVYVYGISSTASSTQPAPFARNISLGGMVGQLDEV
jgi:hypothetical protein